MLPLNESFFGALQQKGVNRRRFMKFCAAMTATLALPPRYVAQVASALEKTRKPVLVWLQFQDCAGNSEAILRSSHPPVLDVVLDLLSWEYHEIIMAGAGHQAEAALERVVKEEKGKYLAVVEGSIPLADDGVYCTVAGKTALSIAKEVCTNAAATIAAGACAWYGGLVAASPNPTGAVGISEAVPEAKVINLGGCPQNPANTAAVLVHYLTFGELPAVDQYNRPLFAYGRIIHDQCERRAHYDAGRYTQEWGDEGHRKGWCLYKMGCKGPRSNVQLPVRAIQRRHELAGEGRARLRRLRRVQLLGDQVSVLRAVAERSGIRGRRQCREDRHRDHGGCSGSDCRSWNRQRSSRPHADHTRARETIRAGRGGAYGTHRSRSSDSH